MIQGDTISAVDPNFLKKRFGKYFFSSQLLRYMLKRRYKHHGGIYHPYRYPPKYATEVNS